MNKEVRAVVSNNGGAESENIRANLVILGGGGAGLAAAVTAAEKGLSKIIVLEKRGVLGGNTALAYGIFAAESPVQRRAVIDASCEDLFKIAMNWAHWKTNPRIVRAFIDKSGDTVRWLEEKGLRFECVAFWPNQSPPVWHLVEGREARLVKVLASECVERGIEILTRTPAKRILIGNNGNVTGVVAERKDERFIIDTKSIIIATGGYGGNKELLKKYCPQYHDNMECDGLHHTGDGLLMAMEIGAATEGLGTLMMSGPQIPGRVMIKTESRSGVIKYPLMLFALEPNTVWVNRNAERFIDESASYNHFECSNAVNRQPGNLSYTLFDQQMVRTMTEHGVIVGFAGLESRNEMRSEMPGLEAEFRRLATSGEWIRISDTWDGIAEWIGAKPEALKTTISEYNAACERGYDPVFAKRRKYLIPLRVPPYYAIKANSDLLDTVGGIKINERMEVLDKQDMPIPGLYAAGVVAGGWQGDTYCALLTGGASGFAINSGRIAAENAVRMLAKG